MAAKAHFTIFEYPFPGIVSLVLCTDNDIKALLGVVVNFIGRVAANPIPNSASASPPDWQAA
jgi:hypothetical protein